MKILNYTLTCVIAFLFSCTSNPGKLLQQKEFKECTFSVYSIDSKSATSSKQDILITIESNEVERKEILRIELENNNIPISTEYFTFLKHKDRDFSLVISGKGLKTVLCYHFELNYILDATVANCLDVVKGEPALKEENFTSAQNDDWMVVKEDWNNLFFRPYLEKNKFQQNCKYCGSITMKVKIGIDQNGNCENVTVLEKEIDCSKKTQEQKLKLEEEMIINLKELKFPSLLRGLEIEVVIGNPTKC